MRNGQRDAVIQVASQLDRRVALDLISLDDDVPCDARLVVDGAERLTQIAVVKTDLRRQQSGERRANVLRVGQSVELVEFFEVVAQHALARIRRNHKSGVSEPS